MAIINFIGKHNTTYDVAKHTHQAWEIIYCTSGSGSITFQNGERLEYKKDDIIAIAPRVIHSNTSVTGFTNLNFTIENFSAPFSESTIFHDNENTDLFHAISQAHYYFHSRYANRDNVIALLSDLIACYINICVGNPTLSSYTQVIENSIISNFSDPNFTIDACLSEIPLSKEYLRKIFTREKKQSPLQFLTEKRLNSAQKLLLAKSENNLSIKEIAEDSGFSDQLYFSRVFKKFTGISPQNYCAPRLENNKNYD